MTGTKATEASVVVGRGRDSGERVLCFLLFGWADGPEMVNRIVGFDAASEAVGV